jgi:hypothetical protein
MPLSFPENLLSSLTLWGGSPWTAADALVGSLRLDEAYFAGDERVQGDPRRPGGLPHDGNSDIATRVVALGLNPRHQLSARRHDNILIEYQRSAGIQVMRTFAPIQSDGCFSSSGLR